MPPLMQWITLCGVIASIGWQAWDARNRVQGEEKARRHSVYDHYWMREILFPICVKPLLDHAETTCSQVANLKVDESASDGTSEEWKVFYEGMEARTRKIADSSAVLSLVSEDVRIYFISNLDKMEDDVAEAVFERLSGKENSLGEIIWKRTTTIISKLASTHSKLG